MVDAPGGSVAERGRGEWLDFHARGEGAWIAWKGWVDGGQRPVAGGASTGRTSSNLETLGVLHKRLTIHEVRLPFGVGRHRRDGLSGRRLQRLTSMDFTDPLATSPTAFVARSTRLPRLSRACRAQVPAASLRRIAARENWGTFVAVSVVASTSEALPSGCRVSGVELPFGMAT